MKNILLLNCTKKGKPSKRDWDMQVLVTGYKIMWTNTDRPDFSKYDPNKK